MNNRMDLKAISKIPPKKLVIGDSTIPNKVSDLIFKVSSSN
jgi:hypothetical protein